MSRIEDTRMPLGEHIEELRGCLIRALIGVAVGMAVCLLFGEHLMKLLCWPAAVALRFRDMPVRLRTLAPAESFVTYLKVCLVCGGILAAPYSLMQIWRFISAGLLDHERAVVRRCVPFSTALFVTGAAFFFVVIAPICLSFFLGFGVSKFPLPDWGSPVLSRSGDHRAPPETPQDAPATEPADGELPHATEPWALMRLAVLDEPPANPAEGDAWIDRASGGVHIVVGSRTRRLEFAPQSFISAEYTLGYYMTFVSWLTLVFGVAFQTPLVVLALARTGLVTAARMKRYRRHVIVVLLVVASTLTPPDIVSQIALALPMYLLFELGLVLAVRGQAAADRQVS